MVDNDSALNAPDDHSVETGQPADVVQGSSATGDQQTTRRGLFRALGDLILGKPESRGGKVGHPDSKKERAMTRRGMLGTTATTAAALATGYGANEARKIVFVDDVVVPYQGPENASEEEIMKEKPSYLTEEEWMKMGEKRDTARVDEKRIEDEGVSPTSEELEEGTASGGSSSFDKLVSGTRGAVLVVAWETMKPLVVPFASSILEYILLKTNVEIRGGVASAERIRDLKTIRGRAKICAKRYGYDALITAAQFYVFYRDIEDMLYAVAPNRAVGSWLGEAGSAWFAFKRIKRALGRKSLAEEDKTIIKKAQQDLDREIDGMRGMRRGGNDQDDMIDYLRDL